MAVPPSRERDQGAVLVMSLIVVVVMGVVVSAIAGFGAVSFRHTRTTRLVTDLRASADAGVRYELEQLALGRPCLDSPALPISTNSANVAVDCSYIAGAELEVTAFAAILTGIGTGPGAPMLASQGGGDKAINGPLFLADSTPATDLSGGTVRITDGDVWYHSPTCPAAAPVFAPSKLTIAPKPPRTTLCTTQTWQQVAPQPPLPPLPVDVDPPAADLSGPLDGCRVFYPGIYHSPPSLANGNNDANYFVSGDYSFDFNDVMEVDAPLIGGQPDPAGIDVAYLQDPSGPCANVLTEPTVAAREGPGNYGVTIVLGGGARIYVDGNGEMELFSRLQGEKYLSLVTVEAGAPSGYVPSTVGIVPPIVGMKEGNTNDMVTHGLVYAPRAGFQFGNVTNAANAQVVGGLVVAGIDLQGSASATNFVLGVDSHPALSKTVITSTASRPANPGVSVTVRAVVDFRVNRTVLDATTSTAGTIVSATAAFTTRDVGQYVTGEGIPGGAMITSVTNATTAVISPVPTSNGSARTVTIKTPQVAVNSWRKVSP